MAELKEVDLENDDETTSTAFQKIEKLIWKSLGEVGTYLPSSRRVKIREKIHRSSTS